MMKKTYTFLIAASLMGVITGCGKNDSDGYSVTIPTSPTEAASVDTEKDESNERSQVNKVSRIDNTVSSGAESSESAEKSSETSVLIAYFSNPQTDDIDADSSASRTIVGSEVRGNVEYTAMLIQAQTGGDMFRIETVDPYPAEYRSTTDKAKQEQNENARPELVNHLDDISKYDTVYIGFANWWGDMPMAVYSFLDEYDLSGKDINVFVCHGGSRFSSTLSTIASLEPNASVDDNVLTIYWTEIPDAESMVSEWLS